MESFKELGVEKYQIIATFDLKTSKICQDMDKKIFNVEDCNIGVNAPPLHPRCRSDIVPYYEKRYFTSTRAARDADGKTVQIPEDMTYKEWYELYGKDYKVKQDEILKKKKEREKAKKKREKEQELQKNKNDDIIIKNNDIPNNNSIRDFTMERRKNNTGEFKDFKVPLQKKAVLNIAKK